MELRATWDSVYVNALPDSAFALILPDGRKDKSGSTTPRDLRKFPHHASNGSVDKQHVDAAASRIPQADISDDEKAGALAHIEAHQAELGEDKSATHDVETRFVAHPPVIAMRDAETDNPVTTFEGYAAMFNSRTWIGPKAYGFWEEIAPGFFSRALAANVDVVCVVNHDSNYLLGRTASGTLRLREDAHGLWTNDDLPPTQLGRDLAIQVARGDIHGMSFSFSVAPGGETWSVLPDGSELRTLVDAGECLFDVSPVVSPAYTNTTASVRAAEIGRRNAPEPTPAEIDEPEDWRELNERYWAYTMSLRGDESGPDF
jgi:HK97 family phage prohead protease